VLKVRVVMSKENEQTTSNVYLCKGDMIYIGKSECTIPNSSTCPLGPGAREPISIAMLVDRPENKTSNDANVSHGKTKDGERERDAVRSPLVAVVFVFNTVLMTMERKW
jgi:hypothetical protein